LLCAKVSDNVNTHEAEPEFFYGATLDSDEPVGLVLMLRLIDYLCTNYGKDTLVNKLVDSVEIWISPLGDPDELYTRPRPPYLNRNFPCACKQSNHEYGIYTSWEPETKAFLDFFDKHSFVTGADIHSSAECAIWPYASIVTHPADFQWYKMVAEQYRDLAQENSPDHYFTYMGGAIHHYVFYTVHGIRIDCMAYHKHCRSLILEICDSKRPDESTLPDYWDYNYKALLNFIEQVLYGIRGTVSDTLTGDPLNAKVFIENHDQDSSHIYSHLPHGDYYRPIYIGNYNVTFSKDGYYPKTITDVQVQNNIATILNVKLRKISNYIIPEKNNFKDLSINNWYNIKTIEIYDLMGRKVKTLPADGFESWKKWNGVYVVRFVGTNVIQRKVVYLK
jgi:hypothetical protein